MNEWLVSSSFFGVVLSLCAYYVGVWLKNKTRSSFCNPLLVAIALTIAALVCLRIEYTDYMASAKYLSWFLTPATVCLALPLYEQFETLKRNPAAILCGILSGVVTSLVSVLLLSLVLHFSHAEYVTFLPKSVTTAIGMGISEELGGYGSLTAAVIILTGVTGAVICEKVFRLFRIDDPVARGIALGSASHAIGTSRAMELGSTEGAMSSLSIVVSGILTVVGAAIFAPFL